MTDTIEAGTSWEWLDAQRPVTVLDVRRDEDRAEWASPGSVHVDACDALLAGQPGAGGGRLAIRPHRGGRANRCAVR